MVKDKAKQTKIWDHKQYKKQITNIFKNSKFYKKIVDLTKKNAISVMVRDRAKWSKIWDHKGYKSQIRQIDHIDFFYKIVNFWKYLLFDSYNPCDPKFWSVSHYLSPVPR